MVFSSSVFLFLFFPCTLIGYLLIRAELRNLFLLLASLFFYAWGEIAYALVLAGSIILNYVFGLIIDRCRQRAGRAVGRLALGLGISCNLLLLLYFKYANFLLENINLLLIEFSLEPIQFSSVHWPIGISFFTFQAISYLVDVYRRDADVQRSITNFALYIASFPKLIAGPIVRYHQVAEQIVSRTITLAGFSSGIQRLIFGLSKKLVLANPLGETADSIFSVPGHDLTTGMAWLGAICYSLQIYFDFSGYSDMAIGLGRMFGFEFPENFDYPYISQSIREFWRRWHISLSSWFRDYLYIPLGGSRVSTWRTHLNLWTVFLICGFWHGASWNFVIWGILHGACLVVERAGFHRVLVRIWRPFRHIYAFGLVTVAWVFFRAETLSSALHYLATMIGVRSADGIKYYALMYLDMKTVITLICASLFATPLSRVLASRTLLVWQYSSLPVRVLLAVTYYVLLCVLFALAAAHLAVGTYDPFIYFRF